jgi:cyanophycinase-like exopeptidase
MGIDEDTAACGDGTTWTVLGRGMVTVVGADGTGPTEYRAGSTLEADLGLALGARF